MKKIVIFTICILCFLVIFTGNIFYNNKIQTTVAKAKQQEKEQIQLLIDNKDKNVIEWLKFKKREDINLTLAVLGSSVTKGAGASEDNKKWPNLLQSSLKSKIGDIKLLNYGFGGYTTTRIINENKITEIINSKPDVVIFEATLINNFDHSISIEKTKSEISNIMQKLTEGLPDSLILVQTSNPIEKTAIREFSEEEYEEYNREVSKFIQSNGWNYINVYDHFINKINQENLELSDLLADGMHPNDKGYDVWFKILNEAISNQKLNINN